MFERIKEDVQCVFERDPSARNVFEILTTYPGVHAVILHRLAQWFWISDLKWSARMVATFSRWLTGIEIHPAATIGSRFFIDHGMGVVIGETAVIGDDCTLYHGVTLGGTSWSKGKRHPTLGNDVVVGAGAKVLGPITIGDGARIGSNAVVMKEVPSRTTVVGVPGRIVRRVQESEGAQERRQEIAAKMGFDAYGSTKDMPDPVATTINKLLDPIHAMDSRMEQMCGGLKQLGAEIGDIQINDLDSCEIRSAGEEPIDAGGDPETEKTKVD